MPSRIFTYGAGRKGFIRGYRMKPHNQKSQYSEKVQYNPHYGDRFIQEARGRSLKEQTFQTGGNSRFCQASISIYPVAWIRTHIKLIYFA